MKRTIEEIGAGLAFLFMLAMGIALIITIQ